MNPRYSKALLSMLLGLVLSVNEYDRVVTVWVTPNIIRPDEWAASVVARLACATAATIGFQDPINYELNLILPEGEKSEIKNIPDSSKGTVWCRINR